jgi:hypothetical protein
MTDIPILFSAPMVLAMIDGRKTQTRRLAWGKPFGVDGVDDLGAQDLIRDGYKVSGMDDTEHRICWRPSRWQKAKAGDRLWVREAWRPGYGADWFREDLGRVPRPSDYDPKTTAIEYLADNGHELAGKNRPGIHMPRWVSRLTLELVEAPRIEPLQAISQDDAQAEGATFHDGRGIGHSGYRHDPTHGHVYRTPRESFQSLWSRVHGDEESWNGNPDVIVLTFKVHKTNIDRIAA